MIHDLNPGEKEKKVIEVFEYLYNSSEFELYNEETLIDNDNYDFCLSFWNIKLFNFI